MLKKIRSFWHRLIGRQHDVSGPAHLQTGIWGEEQAELFLKRKGYRIHGRRVKVGFRGELDLIARSPEDVLVFVEVKTRADEQFGRPFAAVDARKRKVLSRTAWNYLKKMRPKPNYFRFDVVEVIGSPERGKPEVRHIENAFSLLGTKRINW